MNRPTRAARTAISASRRLLTWLAATLSLAACTTATAQPAEPAPTSTAAASAPTSTAAAWRYTPAENKQLPPMFRQGQAQRPDGSTLTFFLGNFNDGLNARKPLLIFLDGSGAQSHFIRVGDKLGYSIFGLIASHASVYHVAAAEKRGVEFAANSTRGAAQGASAEYNRHATIQDRVADVRLLLDALLAEPNVDASRVLLVGHSEGADVAAVAAAEDARITHVAFLSGGGPPQFFDFYVMRRKQMREQGAAPEQIEAAIAQLDDEIRAVLDDPGNEEKLWLGHAYKRWATFATTSAAEHLARTRARLFLAHGSEDTSVPIESFDYLVMELLRRGRRDFSVRRYPGCDHGYMKAGQEPSSSPFLAVLDEVLAWAAVP